MLVYGFFIFSNPTVVAGTLLGSARATARLIYIAPPTCSKANRYLSTERTTLLCMCNSALSRRHEGQFIYLSLQHECIPSTAELIHTVM